MWRSTVWGWVVLPILGFLPVIPIRISQVWFWVVSSVVVLAIGVRQPIRQVHPVFGWGLLGLLLCWLPHWTQGMAGSQWLSTSGVILAATWIIAERADWTWIRQTVIVCAWCQIPLVCWTIMGHRGWWPQTDHGHIWGTVGQPSMCAILLGVASLWSTRWRAWSLALASVATGSFTVWPVIVARLVKRPLRPLLALAIVGAWTRLLSRVALWKIALSQASLWGVGFLPFHGGFQDDTPIGHLLGWRDWHNVYLDVALRFGWVGSGVAVACLAWMWHASKTQEARWTTAFCAWVGCVQSAEALPLLSLIGLCWMIGLCNQKEESHAVCSLQTVAAVDPVHTPQSVHAQASDVLVHERE